MIDAKDSSFKSYIVDEKDLESINLTDDQRTKFLDGETMVCEAKRVLLFAPLTDRKKASLGILTITTFKLSFVSVDIVDDNNKHIDDDDVDDTGDDCCYQRNLLLGPNDVCLSSIDTIYQIGDRTKKKLLPGQSISGKIKELLIICKNMRFLELSFKLADKDSGKNVANALLHHCYPKRHSLLFAYDYKEPYIGTTLLKEVRLFRKRDDWKRELDRTKCKNWRPSVINENYQASQTLLSTLIIPQSVTDSLLSSSIEYFRNRYCPLWVWGNSDGAALVRMADLLPTVPDRTQENILLEHIRKSHPDKKQPYIIDLTKDCPLPKDIQISFLKLRELCIPENVRIFKNQDFKFYGLLDSTKWLLYVSICLNKAVEASEQIVNNNCTVVLQEGNGQDLNCVISSLTQIILDPYFRTKYGFQSLIQKDWVVMGHPFAYRLGHLLDKDIEQSPIFLLFLDCVWQLLQQYPRAFQISETYLTTIWDSVHISIFDTCLFNCEHDRVLAEVGGTSTGHGPLILRSMWDWREQFNEKDISLFCNPLYDDSFKQILHPSTTISQLDIWLQCYFRWLPDLEIRNGGRPQIDLFNRFIVSNIIQLQQQINNPNELILVNGGGGGGSGSGSRNKNEYLELMKQANSFYPFSYHNYGNNHNISSNYSGGNNHLLPLSNILLSGGDLLDTQSILNLNNND